MTTINFQAYSSILFDLDGTILNSEPLHMKSLQLLLKNAKIACSMRELSSRYHGLDDTAVLEDLNKRYPSLMMNQETFVNIKNTLYINELESMEDIELEHLITPGFRSFFKKIIPNHKVGVVSASEKDVVYATLNRLNICNELSVVEFRKNEVSSKPSPLPYLNTIKHLQDRPPTTLIFEDSKAGLQAAHSSGSSVVQISCFTAVDQETPHITDFKSL